MIEIKNPDISYQEFPGPILLLAGPGTGKTWQLAMRIKHLILDRGLSPQEIAVITFTTEASRNMRERLSKEDINLPPEKRPATIATMHSLGNAILGSAPDTVGLSEDYAVIADEPQRLVILQDAATLAGFSRSDWKLTDDCRKKGDCKEDSKSDKCKTCRVYRLLLRKSARIDYDDQIFLANKILTANGKVREEWQSKARYLLIDEYQDINEAQSEFIQLLTKGQEAGVFAVGDDDQSIYSFRGGNPKYIRDFEKYFGDRSKIGRLSKSRRCPEHVLKGARSVISAFYKGSVPKPEPVFPDSSPREKIQFYDVPSDTVEASIIAALASDKIKSNTVTLIIPNSKYLPPIKDAIIRKGLDYRYKSSFDHTGIIRFTVLADWAENPHENIITRYLIDLITQNHDKLVKKIGRKGTKISEAREEVSILLANVWKAVSDEISYYNAIGKMLEKNPTNEFLEGLKQCLDEIKDLILESGSSRTSLVPFLEQCGLLVAPGKNPANIISEIREWKNEKVAERRGSSFAPVDIYNMPSSKGLEGDVVIVIGLSKDLFPKDGADVSESCRLFYVAMTRAKKELHIFSARKRPASITFKEGSYQLKPSPFVDAVPAEHLERRYMATKKKGT